MIDIKDYFDAAFVLTDIAFVKRQRFAAEQCSKLTIPFAFHYDESRKPYGYTQYPRITQTPESGIGEIGCALVHYTCWEKCLKAGFRSVLILEDDVIVADNANDTLAGIMEHVPDDWTVLYLGVNRLQNLTDRRPVNEFCLTGKTNFYSHLGGAWAYALSFRGLEFIVNTFASDDQKMRSDGMLYETITASNGNGYVAIPQVFRHAGMPSEIRRKKLI